MATLGMDAGRHSDGRPNSGCARTPGIPVHVGHGRAWASRHDHYRAARRRLRTGRLGEVYFASSRFGAISCPVGARRTPSAAAVASCRDVAVDDYLLVASRAIDSWFAFLSTQRIGPLRLLFKRYGNVRGELGLDRKWPVLSVDSSGAFSIPM